ncbi:sigma-70 family RNA polymerase sigma factor [Gemmata sp. JC673]|uniref:Sigma-70 family RNA polymerase sigma factor n=1 Tax=Gemmata algarum TaxID=2975278 RepID=A0ABU5F3L2_9BACT|nr:sigma-70 family RNA polymerase sigma factor [Gemmata algarum]MDY3561300.1 sigma-70 family RNA polymerase sigma factor [Gemmata algarum]
MQFVCRPAHGRITPAGEPLTVLDLEFEATDFCPLGGPVWQYHGTEFHSLECVVTHITLARLIRPGPCAGAPDADLLARYSGEGDEAAFAELLRRHGPMVRSVAYRALRDRHAADDVVQAVFLILTRQAGRLTRPDQLAGWLFGVSRRVALRAVRVRRQHRAAPLRADLSAPAPCDPGWSDLLRVLDDELARLPEDERVPLVLCYLEGLTQDEAARVCGWSVRTVRRRLAAGRDRLRRRLDRRGVELGAALTALAVAASPGRAMPLELGTGPMTGRVSDLVRAELGSGRWAALVGLVAGLAVAATVAIGGLAPARTAAPPAAPAPRVVTNAPADPDLPSGALARLGSVRFRHTEPIELLAVSPDGRTVYARGGGWLSAWDAGDGRRLFRVEIGADTGYRSFGTLFAAADAVRGIRVDGNGREDKRYSVVSFDPRTGRELTRAEIAAGVAVSPDGSRIVRWDAGAAVIEPTAPRPISYTLFDVASNKEIAVLGRGLRLSVQFSANGRTVVLADHGASFRAFDAATGKLTGEFRFGGENGRQMTTIRAGTEDMRLAVPTPDGRALAFWGLDGEKAVLKVWDIGAKTARTLGDGDGPFAEDSIAISPDGSRVATFRRRVGWTVRDTATAKEIGRIPQPGTSQRAALSADGRTLYTIRDRDSVVTVLDVASGRAVEPRPDTTGEITDLRFDRAGRWTALADGALVTWDAATGRIANRSGPFPIGKPASSSRWAVSADCGRVFRTDSSFGFADVSDVGTGKIVWAQEGGHPGKIVWAREVGHLGFVHAEFDPTGQRVFAAHSGWAIAFDGRSGKTLWTATAGTGYGAFGTALAVNPDGRSVALAGGWASTRRSGTLGLFDAATGKQLHTWESAGFEAGALTFAPDGRTLYAAEAGENYTVARVRAYRTGTGKVVTTFNVPTPLPRVATVSPDGRTLAVASGRHVHLLEPLTGRLRHTFTGHEARVSALRFRPDGRVLAAASPDAPVLLWDVYGTSTGRRPLPAPDGLGKAWDDLAGADAQVAFRAVRVLAAGTDAIPVLRERMKAVRPPDLETVNQWVADLSSADFATRERATAALAKVARLVEPELRKAREASERPEVRQRLDAVLADAKPSAEELRVVRAVEAVEAIGTPAAAKLLGEWAEAGGLLAQEAKAAVARLNGM